MGKLAARFFNHTIKSIERQDDKRPFVKNCFFTWFKGKKNDRSSWGLKTIHRFYVIDQIVIVCKNINEINWLQCRLLSLSCKLLITLSWITWIDSKYLVRWYYQYDIINIHSLPLSNASI